MNKEKDYQFGQNQNNPDLERPYMSHKQNHFSSGAQGMMNQGYGSISQRQMNPFSQNRRSMVEKQMKNSGIQRANTNVQSMTSSDMFTMRNSSRKNKHDSTTNLSIIYQF